MIGQLTTFHTWPDATLPAPLPDPPPWSLLGGRLWSSKPDSPCLHHVRPCHHRGQLRYQEHLQDTRETFTAITPRPGLPICPAIIKPPPDWEDPLDLGMTFHVPPQGTGVPRCWNPGMSLRTTAAVLARRRRHTAKDRGPHSRARRLCDIDTDF